MSPGGEREGRAVCMHMTKCWLPTAKYSVTSQQVLWFFFIFIFLLSATLIQSVNYFGSKASLHQAALYSINILFVPQSLISSSKQLWKNMEVEIRTIFLSSNFIPLPFFKHYYFQKLIPNLSPQNCLKKKKWTEEWDRVGCVDIRVFLRCRQDYYYYLFQKDSLS